VGERNRAPDEDLKVYFIYYISVAHHEPVADVPPETHPQGLGLEESTTGAGATSVIVIWTDADALKPPVAMMVRGPGCDVELPRARGAIAGD
jgi:hypothetical protein